MKNYCDYISQQMYWKYFNPHDPLLYNPVDEQQHPDLQIGLEHYYWGYYTDGLDIWIYGENEDQWAPVLDDDSEHPFFCLEWHSGAGDTPEQELTCAASQIAEMFTIDVFPEDPDLNHRLLKYNVPGWGWWTIGEDGSTAPGARVMDTMSKLLTGMTFLGDEYYVYENGTPPGGDDYVKISYSWVDSDPEWDDMVSIVRSYEDPKTDDYDLVLEVPGVNEPDPDTRMPVYDVQGNFTDRGVVPIANDFYVEFAANELRPDEVLIIDQSDGIVSADNYSQAIQLERGWNLVSWYIYPEGDGQSPIYMDDIFWDSQAQPPNYVEWFNPYPPEAPPEAGDRVGTNEYTPYQLYPDEPGSGSWEWYMNQAFYIHLDEDYGTSHFWEVTDQPDYPPTSFDITPTDNWDDWRLLQAPPDPATYWYFLGYPLRKQLKIDESVDLDEIFNDPDNRCLIVKDDKGRWYNPISQQSNLDYLEPGRGYFLGFGNGEEVPFGGFAGDYNPMPESIPPAPDPKVNQPTTSSAIHFQYNSGTHWFYPIEIDTIVIEGFTLSTGDEIAVFDEDLCVGATVYDGEFPVLLAAWKDDIATPNEIDGYDSCDVMIFKLFDVSENQEITFELPPQIASMQPEVDPLFPIHSGFGVGLCALRSLTYGVESVNQLPLEYVLGQNYPNPFNAETVIPLALPQRSQIKIELFNIMGQKVDVIYEGIKDAGWANVRYSTKSLPSGVYIYYVTAEGLERGGKFQDTGKMLLLK